MNAYEVLRNLQSKKNVLLMGAPGTGKSMIMNKVAQLFENGVSISPMPTHQPGTSIPIPAIAQSENLGELPMMHHTHRKVFRTTLHQNSKYRDFLTGIIPRFDGNNGYKISEGILYRANEFAKRPDSAALLIIDELNRGPAIEVFGGSIVAIESDKRLGKENNPNERTQFFEIIDPVTGNLIEYAFSSNLYILAAMNQADVSVAPLDVAFLRRWKSIKLSPDYSPVYERYDIQDDTPIAENNPSVGDIYHVVIKALEIINQKIVIGRGPEYQLGQGVLLSSSPQSNSLLDVLDFAVDVWDMIYTHIEELFFGEPMALAYILNAEHENSPYALKEVDFAGETKYILTHRSINRNTIYGLYYSLLEGNNS